MTSPPRARARARPTILDAILDAVLDGAGGRRGAAGAVRERCSAAFSLLEVMFAASILIISLTGVAGVYSSVQRSLAHQRDLAAATVIAEAFLEQIVVLPKTNRFLIAGNHPSGGEFVNRFGLDAQPTTAADAPFLLTWVVEDDKPLLGIRTVTVDVEWNRDGVHHVRLMTYRE